MTLLFGRDESHPMVDALLRTRVERAGELNRAIDERDDMLDFAVQLMDRDLDAALVNYFENGLEQFELVQHVARWRDRRPARLLDFASGYGRLTRFLVHQHLADEITVSDILTGGMEFQAAQFGVRTIVSTTLPQDSHAPSKYDLIFVASLFTHLPPATFKAWLQKLIALLEPDGLLIFSVHDESIAPEAVDDGIRFASFSESRVLDAEEYGSTWVTEPYVRAEVAAIAPSLACVRLARALSDWQDVYVVSPSPIAHPMPRRAPKGFIEHFDITDAGIEVSGWAAVRAGELDRVELRIDDSVVAVARSFGRRDDVAAAFGSQSAALSGWQLTVPHSAIRSFRYQIATVTAFSREGVERILYLGTIDAATAAVARARARARDEQILERNATVAALEEEVRQLQHHKMELEQHLAAMRQSRFWKARDAWFAFKRAVRLTDEE